MNDSKLHKELRSAGMEWFAEYYSELSDWSLNSRDLIEKMCAEKNYKRDSSQTKVYAGRRIIKAGRSKDALILITNSKNDRAAVLAQGQLDVISKMGGMADFPGDNR